MTVEEVACIKPKVGSEQTRRNVGGYTLVTLEKFCGSMPVTWMVRRSARLRGLSFMLREPDCQIQIRAVECVWNSCCSGENGIFQDATRCGTPYPSTKPIKRLQPSGTSAERAAKGLSGTLPDPLTLNLGFHRALSRMMANRRVHITSIKVTQGENGPHAEQLQHFTRLLVDIHHHPSGTHLPEQLNTWVALAPGGGITNCRGANLTTVHYQKS
jgi:hypothetical protein